MSDTILARPPAPGDVDNAPSAYADPVVETARHTFHVPALYPYQRLVVANILDAACDTSFTTPALGDAFVRPENQTALGPEANPAIDAEVPGTIMDARSRQLVILPTGAGKSLCFQLPSVLLDGPTVVVYPLLSLMADQARRLGEAGVGCAVLRGGQALEDRRKALSDARSGTVRILLTNPETLCSAGVLRSLREIGTSHLVIDEAHCVSEWGRTFRPSYLELGRCIEALSPRVVTAFTATASPEVLAGIRSHLFPDGCHLIQGNPDRSNIAYHVVPVLSRTRAVLSLLGGAQGLVASDSSPEYRPRAGDTSGGVAATRSVPMIGPPRLPAWRYGEPLRRPAIVFCRSRTGVELTAALLRRRLRDPAVFFYHAGLTRTEKSQVEQWFYHSDSGVLVATCAYGMGVDKKNIRSVVHLEPPPSIESYLQESGRGGRDGNPAQAVMLLTGTELPVVSDEGTSPHPPQLDTLGGSRQAQVLAYAHADGCRRDALLAVLGWDGEEPCFGCDRCFGSSVTVPAEERACLQAIGRNRRRFTNGELAEVLRGGYRGFDWFPTRPPALPEWGKVEAEEVLDTLRSRGRIRTIRRGPWRGRVDICRGLR